MDKIATIITNLRKEKSWSQTDLANQSEVSREMISKYERSIAVPSVDAAKKIADALGVTLDYLTKDAEYEQVDKDTLDRLKEIQKLSPESKSHVYAIYHLTTCYTTHK